MEQPSQTNIRYHLNNRTAASLKRFHRTYQKDDQYLGIGWYLMQKIASELSIELHIDSKIGNGCITFTSHNSNNAVIVFVKKNRKYQLLYIKQFAKFLQLCSGAIDNIVAESFLNRISLSRANILKDDPHFYSFKDLHKLEEMFPEYLNLSHGHTQFFYCEVSSINNTLDARIDTKKVYRAIRYITTSSQTDIEFISQYLKPMGITINYFVTQHNDKPICTMRFHPKNFPPDKLKQCEYEFNQYHRVSVKIDIWNDISIQRNEILKIMYDYVPIRELNLLAKLILAKDILMPDIYGIVQMIMYDLEFGWH